MADPCDLEVGAVVAEEVGAVGGSAAEGEELGEEDAACEVVVAACPALLGEEADALAFGGAGSDDGEGGVGWGKGPLGVWVLVGIGHELGGTCSGRGAGARRLAWVETRAGRPPE